jgi:hypothetical protein
MGGPEGSWGWQRLAVVTLAAVALAAPAADLSAGPAEDCLAPAGEPREAAEACERAAALARFSSRDFQSSRPGANPAAPPALRGSRFPLADLEVARARHLARAGDRAGARAALTRALRINAAVPGAAAFEAMIGLAEQ